MVEPFGRRSSIPTLILRHRLDQSFALSLDPLVPIRLRSFDQVIYRVSALRINLQQSIRAKGMWFYRAP